MVFKDQRNDFHGIKPKTEQTAVRKINCNDSHILLEIGMHVRKKLGAGRSNSFTYRVQESTTHGYLYETY